MHGPLVDVADLRVHGARASVIDARFVLGDPAAPDRLYDEGHIPGAASLDVDRDLSGPPGAGGRHPLPDPRAFERAARGAGISQDVPVVVYDEAGEGGAVRLWWLLRHFGHERVAVLDGGLAAWRGAGGELANGAEAVAEGDFVARPRQGDLVGVDAAADAGRRGALVDARAPERFRGEQEPIDPVAGHIPGARSLPLGEIAPEGRFLEPGELHRRLGPEPVVAYCGSGITACGVVLAAELAGVGAQLFPGGWSEWSQSDRPVERG